MPEPEGTVPTPSDQPAKEPVEGAIPNNSSKASTEKATLGQMTFTLIVLFEDKPHLMAKATSGSCVLEGRNSNGHKNYQLDLLLKKFEAELNEGRSGDDCINLEHGQLSYELNSTTKIVKRQEHFEIAVNYLFSARGDKHTLDFVFHPETLQEKAIRENVEKASQRTRAHKMKEVAKTTTASGAAAATTPKTSNAKPQAVPGPKAIPRSSTRKTEPAAREPISTPKNQNKFPRTTSHSRVKALPKRAPTVPQKKSSSTTAIATAKLSKPESVRSSIKAAWNRLFRHSFSFRRKTLGRPVVNKYQEQDRNFRSLYTVAGIETFVRGLNEDEDGIPNSINRTDEVYVDDIEDPLCVEGERWGKGSASGYLTRELDALQGSEELSQMIELRKDETSRWRNAHGKDKLYRWRDCCRLFQINPDNVGIDERVNISGLNSQLYQYQAFAVYWQMITSREFGGGFVGDEMGLGKTLTFLAYIVVERQLAWLWQDIAKSREKGDRRHIPQNQKHLDDAVCPSNSERPNWIACPCMDSNPTSQMPAKHGVRLACVSPPLIQSWMSQWKTHVDEKETTIGMSLAVAHPPSFAIGRLNENEDARRPRNISYLGAAKVKIQDQGGMLKDAPKPNQERFLLLTTAEVYKSWVRKTFEYETVGLSTNKTGKESYAKTKNRGIVFGIAVTDECHEDSHRTKGRSAVLADLPSTERPFLWGYSGTPLLNSPRGLAGVLWAIEFHGPKPTRSSSGLHKGYNISYSTLSYASSLFEEYIKGKHITEVVPQQLRHSLMPILTTFMIRRTADSSWFGHPLVRLKPHYHHDIKLKHTNLYQEEFGKFIDILSMEMSKKKFEMWENRQRTIYTNDGDPVAVPEDITFNITCGVRWKLHICITFPYLVKLALLPPKDRNHLDFSAKECNTWSSPLSEKRSPYYKHLRNIVESSPKCLWLYGFIRRLMETKDTNGPEQKLVILTRFSAVALVVKLFIERYIPSTAKRVGLVITGSHPRARTATLEAFTDALQSNGQRKQKDNFQFLVGTTPVIGKGLDLSRAANVVLMEPDFQFSRELQAYARIHRIGQISEKTNSWRLIIDNQFLQELTRLNPEWEIVTGQWARSQLVGHKVLDDCGFEGIDEVIEDDGDETTTGVEGKGKGKGRQRLEDEDVGPLGERISDLPFSMWLGTEDERAIGSSRSEASK